MIASIIVKVIGALFSIPLTNLYGADGTGIFNVAYYIYTAMFIISTAGLPVAVSKMVAEDNKNNKRILSSTTVFSLFINIVLILIYVCLTLKENKIEISFKGSNYEK